MKNVIDPSSADRVTPAAARSVRLRAGVFVAPFHPLDEDPSLCLERDLQLAVHCDDLALSEFWFGEHHSGAYEMSASPELMIAAAAQRTRRIRLGTGVVSLPYHNPLMVANRIAQLDHMSFGRTIFGAGPGLLAGDAHMLGLDVMESREKLDVALGVITRLLAGEWVSEDHGWFSLTDAHCQLLPYAQSIEICVASTFSPSGGKLAAKYDAGMLCLTSTLMGGYDALSNNWRIACDESGKRGRAMSPERIRCATDIHIAETREKAMEQCREGFVRYQRYIANQSGHLAESPAHLSLEEMVERQEVVVGTPDDAVAQIRRLEAKVPDFGCLLVLDKNWAGFEDKKRSLEMLARYVLPEINGTNSARQRSFDWTHSRREGFVEVTRSSAKKAFGQQAAPVA